MATLGFAALGASADSTHVVKSGETLSLIAQNNDTTVSKIAEINNIANPNLIYVGDELKLDGVSTRQNTSVTTINYVTPKKQVVSAPVKTSSNVASTTSSTTAKTSTVKKTSSYTSTANTGDSTKAQFLANGGTEAMWNTIVMPESGGNTNASNGQYHGLGQTNQSWGYGSVANQTKGMVNYAVSRYGSVSAAIQFRQANGWW